MGRQPTYNGVSAKSEIDRLEQMGLSKYRIAKELQVTWRTVDQWHKERVLVSPERIWGLQTLCAAVAIKNLDAKQKIEIPVDNDPFAD